MSKIEQSPLAPLEDLITTPLRELTSFHKLILHAIHTFGNGRVHANATDRFVNMVIALEAFLTSGDGNITQAVSEGAVLFFAVPVSERVQLKKDIQRLYKVRSKLSHGDHAIVLAEDLFQLEDIVKSFLTAMIEKRDKFRNKSDLHRMLEQHRLR